MIDSVGTEINVDDEVILERRVNIGLGMCKEIFTANIVEIFEYNGVIVYASKLNKEFILRRDLSLDENISNFTSSTNIKYWLTKKKS